ncbi:hypothetical protein EDF68_103290 [Ochrobactrum sp. BH3]|nr:hypothetical protein EDF68_103290 [Ochrobactrum sp. BH3]
MSSKHVPAAAEGMPKIQMTRRSMLAGAVGVAVAGTSITGVTMAEPSVSELESLIERHRIALKATSAAWDQVGDIEDGTDWSDRCEVRVQVGNLLSGWDKEGNQILRPIYAYSDTEVDIHLNRTLQSSINLAWSDVEKARTAERYDEKKAELKAVLRECDAQNQAIEDRVGMTAAKHEAQRCSSITVALEDAIIDLVPANLNDAALKAQFIVSQHDDAFFDEERLMNAFKSIAAALGNAGEKSHG